MIKAVVAGASGRMGKRLVALMRESADFRIVGAVERKDHVDVGRDAGEVAGVGPLGVAILDVVDKAGGLSRRSLVSDISLPLRARAAARSLFSVQSTWPTAPETLWESLAGLPDADIHKITCGRRRSPGSCRSSA